MCRCLFSTNSGRLVVAVGLSSKTGCSLVCMFVVCPQELSLPRSLARMFVSLSCLSLCPFTLIVAFCSCHRASSRCIMAVELLRTSISSLSSIVDCHVHFAGILLACRLDCPCFPFSMLLGHGPCINRDVTISHTIVNGLLRRLYGDNPLVLYRRLQIDATAILHLVIASPSLRLSPAATTRISPYLGSSSRWYHVRSPLPRMCRCLLIESWDAKRTSRFDLS